MNQHLWLSMLRFLSGWRALISVAGPSWPTAGSWRLHTASHQPQSAVLTYLNSWSYWTFPRRAQSIVLSSSSPLCREFLSGVRVAVGEFDRRVDDEEEQVFGVKSVSVHEKYSHSSPMIYDLALVELDGDVRLGRFHFWWLVYWSNDGEMLTLITFY